MELRRELIKAVTARYHAGTRSEKKDILDEFTKVTGFHRKFLGFFADNQRLTKQLDFGEPQPLRPYQRIADFNSAFVKPQEFVNSVTE